jgi:hypothetical protein
MELISDDEFRLEDHVNKCRCCFRGMAEDQKFVKITDRHEQKFFDLTQIKVRDVMEIAGSWEVFVLCNDEEAKG